MGRPVAGATPRTCFARLADGSGVVIDVRPDDRIEPKDAEAFDATGRACGLAGWGFRRVGRSRTRCWRRTSVAGAVPAPAVRAAGPWPALLLEVFAAPAPLMAGAVAAGDPMAVLPVLFHLMWRHALTADLAVRLPPETARRGRDGSGQCPVTGRPGGLGIGDRVRFGGGTRR